MSVSCKEQFERHYEAHLKHLRLKGLQPKTIEAYARAVRTAGAYFDGCIDALSEQQLLDYFTSYCQIWCMTIGPEFDQAASRCSSWVSGRSSDTGIPSS